MAKMPSRVTPMLCTLLDDPPSGREWAFETKWDGERIIAFIGRGKAGVRLTSRTHKDNTARYPELTADLAKRINAKETIIDGEVVALSEKGMPDFGTLQRRLGLMHIEEIRLRMADTPVWYMAFDLLWLDGKDLRRLPLVERRRLLKKVIGRCKRTRYSHSYDDAQALLGGVRKLGLEGIVGKRKDSPYLEGERTKLWVKVKVTEEQEFVIGGWTEGKGRRHAGFGALILGVYEKRKGKKVLVPVGSVGSGFDDALIADLKRKLKRLETKRMPFADAPAVNDVPHWVRPKLVAQVRFANWTANGTLRVPVYLGLRDDKRPEDCVR